MGWSAGRNLRADPVEASDSADHGLVADSPSLTEVSTVPRGANVVDGGAKWSTVAQSGGQRRESGGHGMFLGTYTPKLDDKGRLFLPAKFREELMAGLVVTTGQERCLTVYKLGDFAEIAARVQAAPITVKGARDYGRFLGANANQDTPDKQGRITITPMQRDYAALTRDVMVLGVINRIEIWDPARWKSYNQQNQETFADIT